MVHGDHVTFAGTESELKKIKVKSVRVVRCQGARNSRRGRRDVQEIELLGRTLRWTEKDHEYEAGGKRRQTLLRVLGLSHDLTTVNSAATEEDEEILGAEDWRQFRSLAVTLKYISLYRSAVQCAAQEVCTNPTWGSWRRPKKAGRYLKGVQKVRWLMQAWDSVDVLSLENRHAEV